ncbi:hypothetical protein AGDE_09442 [Angomonas deanei]|uniref:Uncharacterized protein n=1 Tax=Angomonas deanei TaxID=59799 RepID=A0A7G2BZY1_9TRYP|nr:hypothetical protein AGDE_09442 [Angomonas deanei]CAD2212825.1 hypothetical protein, conserved [Angomonas deanei]|eukprot:EPY30441.1 hypothetical protein AGDE_09442 [Angomonas deanei]
MHAQKGVLASKTSMGWAYEALLGYTSRTRSATLLHTAPLPMESYQEKGSSAAITAERLSPNILLSTEEETGTRGVLLAQRPDGVISGVALTDGRLPYSPSTVRGTTRSKRLCKLHQYLTQQRFSLLTETPVVLSDALLLHTNHLVGYKLNTRTATLYAHTLREIASLPLADQHLLRSTSSVVAAPLWEWDSWKEVLGEPAWDLYYGGGEVLEAILAGEISTQHIRQHAREVDFS